MTLLSINVIPRTWVHIVQLLGTGIQRAFARSVDCSRPILEVLVGLFVCCFALLCIVVPQLYCPSMKASGVGERLLERIFRLLPRHLKIVLNLERDERCPTVVTIHTVRQYTWIYIRQGGATEGEYVPLIVIARPPDLIAPARELDSDFTAPFSSWVSCRVCSSTSSARSSILASWHVLPS